MLFFQLHRNIQIRILTSFLSRAVGSMIFPFMAIYFTETLSASWAGILLFINVTATLVTGFYGGYITDSIGRKKVLVAGQMLTVISFLCMTFSNSPWFSSPWLTFAMMLLNSVASGLTNPAAEAMLIDVSTKETRAFMYSVNYWAVNLSAMIGAMVGGWFFKAHRFELFASLTAVSLLTFFIIALWMTEVYQPKKQVEKVNILQNIIHSYRIVMTNTSFMIFSFASILILALEFQRNNFIAVRLEHGFDTTTLSLFGQTFSIDGIRMLSLITTENTFLVVILTVAVAAWITNRRELPLLYSGALLQAVGFATLAFHNSIPVLLIACFIQTMGEMIYVPIRQAKLAEVIDDNARGAYMAMNGFVSQIAKMIGAIGIIIGNFIGGIGMGLLYILLGFIGILLFKKVFETKKESMPQEKTG